MLLALAAALVSPVSAQSIGMAPAQYDLGAVDRGETVDFSIYLSSYGTADNFTVQPEVMEMSIGNVRGSDLVEVEEFSEQNVAPWLSWEEESFLVVPGSSRTAQVGGDTVSYDGRMEGSITVPSTAEPGYHAVQIGVDPDFPSGRGFGASVLGLTRVNVVLRVPGNAERNVELASVTARRTGEREAQFVFDLENTGTVTVQSTGGDFSIVSNTRGKVDSDYFSGVEIPPGATRRVEARWISDEVAGGEYTLEGSVGFETDRNFFREDVSLTSAPQQPINVPDPDDQGPDGGPEQASVPLLLILVAVLGVGSALYVFGVNMTWSALISGGVGIAIFIITSGLPVYILLLMLMGAGTLVYLNW